LPSLGSRELAEFLGYEFSWVVRRPGPGSERQKAAQHEYTRESQTHTPALSLCTALSHPLKRQPPLADRTPNHSRWAPKAKGDSKSRFNASTLATVPKARYSRAPVGTTTGPTDSGGSDDAPVRLRQVTPSGAPALVLLTGQRFTETA
jgi:hypothetical protein